MKHGAAILAGAVPIAAARAATPHPTFGPSSRSTTSDSTRS